MTHTVRIYKNADEFKKCNPFAEILKVYSLSESTVGGFAVVTDSGTYCFPKDCIVFATEDEEE